MFFLYSPTLPSQFAPQCGAFRKYQVKLPHIAQRLNRVPFAVFFRQTSCEIIRQRLAIFGPFLPFVFMLHNQISDLSICLNHVKIDGTAGRRTRLFQNSADFSVKSGDFYQFVLTFIHRSSFRIHDSSYPVIFFQTFRFGHIFTKSLLFLSLQNRKSIQNV